MMLMSLMTLPQITAELFTPRYHRLLLLSGIGSALCCVGGLFLSYFISVPASATIVLLMIAVYLFCRGVQLLRWRKAPQ